MSIESRLHRYLGLTRVSTQTGAPLRIIERACASRLSQLMILTQSGLGQNCIPTKTPGTLSQLVWEPHLENHDAQIWLLVLSGYLGLAQSSFLRHQDEFIQDGKVIWNSVQASIWKIAFFFFRVVWYSQGFLSVSPWNLPIFERIWKHFIWSSSWR